MLVVFIITSKSVKINSCFGIFKLYDLHTIAKVVSNVSVTKGCYSGVISVESVLFCRS